jgi:threonine synthase
LDPHTADGVQVARQLREKLDGPVAVMETALPVKFEETIAEAVGFVPPVPPRFADIEGHEQRVVELPRDVDALKELIRSKVKPER